MNTETTHPQSLRAIELAVEAKDASGHAKDSRNDYKKKPDSTAKFPPLRPSAGASALPADATAHQPGVIQLQVLHGQDPADKHWGCPVREHWELTCHQQLRLGLGDRLAFTVTAPASYEETAAVAQKWRVTVSNSSLHTLTPRLGARGGSPHSETKGNPTEGTPTVACADKAVRADVRQMASTPRRAGLGEEKDAGASSGKARIEDRHLLQTGTTRSHRGRRAVLTIKMVIGWQSDPMKFGRRLHWEALRGGLGRAQAKQVAGDGVPWIWNVAQDRWAGATEVLDFYHASPNLWKLGRALHGEDEARTAKWVEPRRHQLRYGREKQLLNGIAGLQVPPGQTGEVVRREQSYFSTHAGRMNYQSLNRRGWPDRLRPGRVGLSATPALVQTPQTILDAQRHAPSRRAERSPTQSPLG